MYSISEFAGLLVKQAREEKQWDQQYLADELDIDIRTLKKIEAGKSDISFDTLSSLIHLLEISPKILFYADRTETGVEMDKIFRQLMRSANAQGTARVKSNLCCFTPGKGYETI